MSVICNLCKLVTSDPVMVPAPDSAYLSFAFVLLSTFSLTIYFLLLKKAAGAECALERRDENLVAAALLVVNSCSRS